MPVSTIGFNATITGVISAPVVPSLVYDTRHYTSVTLTPNSTTSYSISATTRDGFPGGQFGSPITFRVCQDAACNTPYAGASAAHRVSANVTFRPWTTLQRNASHTGAVNVSVDPSKIAKAWEWTTPDFSFFFNYVIPVNGSAYLSTSAKIYSLSEATGLQNWAHTPPSPLYANGLGGLTYDNGTVYAPVMYSPPTSVFTGEAYLRGFDAVTGAPTSAAQFHSQGGPFSSPTVYDGIMFYSEGYFGNQVYRYEPMATTWTWRKDIASGRNPDQSPVVTDKYVYHATGAGVSILNKSDGSLVADTGPPVGSGGGGNTSPVLTQSGHVIAFDGFDGFRMLLLDGENASVIWRGDIQQGAQPVVARGVIYNWFYSAGRYSLRAMNEANGAVLWSWPQPAGETDVQNNMIICDNVIFVSTPKNTYAIDLATHQTVWTVATGGKLSLSSNLVLYVVQSDFGAQTKVTAYKLEG
ncbi:MAG TPA: PQQ-binding-like beta-propeller repeat protein [Hyphomonadaceae bacterium]|nr:PQQ-binding-like beta-propeller repeat protein [Hyphomonadaceae bacterium]